MQAVSAAVFCSAVAGCATTPPGPVYAGYQNDDAACVEATNWPNPVAFFKDGEAHVWLKQVDGASASDEARVCVARGVNRWSARRLEL